MILWSLHSFGLAAFYTFQNLRARAVMFRFQLLPKFIFWYMQKFLPFGRIAKQFRLMDWWCPSVCPSVCMSTIWLTSAFQFVFGQMNHYRLDTLHGYRPWWNTLKYGLSLLPWPWLFLFKVTLHIWLTSAFKFVLGHIIHYRLDTLHGNRPWWYLLNCDLSLWPLPWLFFFNVTFVFG